MAAGTIKPTGSVSWSRKNKSLFSFHPSTHPFFPHRKQSNFPKCTSCHVTLLLNPFLAFSSGRSPDSCMWLPWSCTMGLCLLLWWYFNPSSITGYTILPSHKILSNLKEIMPFIAFGALRKLFIFLLFLSRLCFQYYWVQY